MAITLEVNGERSTIEADPETPLLWVLRDHLGLTGTRYGCGVAQCGACTVHLDGAPQRACVLPVGRVGGAKITTIEGLDGPAAQAVRAAWVEVQAPQCGYCQSGQIMSATALLSANAKPDDAGIDAAMAGNICRCGTYVRIRQAIHRASETLGER